MVCEGKRRLKPLAGIAIVVILAATMVPTSTTAAPIEDWVDLQGTSEALPGLDFAGFGSTSNIRFFGWNAVTSNAPALHDYLDFGMVMYDFGGQLRFGFVNWTAEDTNGNQVNSSITDIYVDDSGASGSFQFSASPYNLWESSGPDFATGEVNPTSVSGLGNTWTNNPSLSAQSTAPIAPNGIQPIPEWVVLGYDYLGGSTFESVYDSFVGGDIRFAMHVQGLGLGTNTSQSDSFIWTPLDPGAPPQGPGPLDNVVPLPGVAGLGLVGMGLIAITRRFKQRGVQN